MNMCSIICNTAKNKTAKKISNQKDVGVVEANKVSKQGKDCKGSYHRPVCYKQSRVPPSHITPQKHNQK